MAWRASSVMFSCATYLSVCCAQHRSHVPFRESELTRILQAPTPPHVSCVIINEFNVTLEHALRLELFVLELFVCLPTRLCLVRPTPPPLSFLPRSAFPTGLAGRQLPHHFTRRGTNARCVIFKTSFTSLLTVCGAGHTHLQEIITAYPHASHTRGTQVSPLDVNGAETVASLRSPPNHPFSNRFITPDQAPFAILHVPFAVIATSNRLDLLSSRTLTLSELDSPRLPRR